MASLHRAHNGDLALALLRESTGLWGVAATVEAGVAPQVAVLRSVGGVEVRVDAARSGEAPIRWWVRCREPGAQQDRTRPCASVVGMLRTVREALGVPAGARLDIALGGCAAT